VRDVAAGDTYAAPATAIHRMEHEPGAVTIHVYSPPLAEIGHYEVVEGELHRRAGAADEISPPSPELSAALGGASECARPESRVGFRSREEQEPEGGRFAAAAAPISHRGF
jgi:hypothetical protein